MRGPPRWQRNSRFVAILAGASGCARNFESTPSDFYKSRDHINSSPTRSVFTLSFERTGTAFARSSSTTTVCSGSVEAAGTGQPPISAVDDGAGKFAAKTQLPEGPLLLVSPHFDDAALSCAALLARPEPVDVLTVFAGDPDPPRQAFWDVCCGFASSAEAGATRRAEDAAAFAGSRHRSRRMNLLEWQHLDGPRSHTDAEEIRATVSAWAAEVGEGTVALPAGAGRGTFRRRLERRLFRASPGPPRHPDHTFARDAALQALVAHEDLALLLYEELPYVYGAPADKEVGKVAAAWCLTARGFIVEVNREAKALRIAAYASQVPHLSPPERPLDRPANLPPIERYWTLLRGKVTPR